MVTVWSPSAPYTRLPLGVLDISVGLFQTSMGMGKVKCILHSREPCEDIQETEHFILSSAYNMRWSIVRCMLLVYILALNVFQMLLLREE